MFPCSILSMASADNVGSVVCVFLCLCLVALASMKIMGLRMMLLVLDQRRQDSATAGYLHLVVRRFLYCYARGHHADAGVWCRRLAESYCINVLHKKYAKKRRPYPSLGLMIDDLPYAISWARVYDLCEVQKEIATYLGCHLSDATVWADLRKMQEYGNRGVHATAYNSHRLYADPSVFVATLRIALLTLELQPRSRL